MTMTRAPRPRLFRGESRHVWDRRLQTLGWPAVAAREMAQFLTGERRDCLTFAEIAAAEAMASVPPLPPARPRR